MESCLPGALKDNHHSLVYGGIERSWTSPEASETARNRLSKPSVVHQLTNSLFGNAGHTQIESWKTLLPLERTKKPGSVEWYIIPRDRAKLGAKWRPSFQQ